MRSTKRHRESGSATVLTVGLVGALMVLLLGAFTLCAAVAAGHRAAAAADLAALAAAQNLSLAGLQGEACAHAVTIAAANKATLTTCRVTGADVLIEVTVPAPPGLPAAIGRSRAGPPAATHQPAAMRPSPHPAVRPSDQVDSVRGRLEVT